MRQPSHYSRLSGRRRTFPCSYVPHHPSFALTQVRSGIMVLSRGFGLDQTTTLHVPTKRKSSHASKWFHASRPQSRLQILACQFLRRSGVTGSLRNHGRPTLGAICGGTGLHLTHLSMPRLEMKTTVATGRVRGVGVVKEVVEGRGLWISQWRSCGAIRW